MGRASRFLLPVVAILILLAGPAALAESPLSLSFAPGYRYPLGPNAALFSFGAGGSLGLEYSLPKAPALSLGAGLGYGYDAYTELDWGSLSIISAELGLGYRLGLGKALGLRLFAKGGGAWGFENGGGLAEGSFFPVAEGGLGLDWAIARSLALRLDASYLYNVGLQGAVGANLGLAWNLPSRADAAPRLLELQNLKLNMVYPVFRSWYDDHQLGTVTVKNTGKKPAKDVKLSFVIKQYMDAPKLCAEIAELKPGESKEVAVYALLNGSILNVVEATKAAGEVVVEYLAGEAQGRQSVAASVDVNDRCAMTWDDDRKAAAFVSGKDPWVMVLASRAANDTAASRNAALDKNLQIALAVHETLKLYGVSYASSPTNPFEAAKANPTVVDFLKYPRQTLSYKTGDCADLSILYASMLEGLGIETAFVTVPGHIFMAFALSSAPDRAAKMSWSGDLIVKAGKAWLPLETTLRDADFAGAWADGARQWKACSAAGTAGFVPVRDAWGTYKPAGLPDDGTAVVAPAADAIAKAFGPSLAVLADREMAFRVQSVEAAMKRSGKTPKALNDRGIVYASFGKFDLAMADFRAAVATGEYVPALANLGQLYLKKNDGQGAYATYKRAAEAAPENAKIQLGLAKAAALVGKQDEAAAARAKAAALDPALAAQVTAPADQAGARAAEAESAESWEQE